MFKQCSSPIWIFLAGFAAVPLPQAFAAADERAGEQVYRQMCARCHGKTGEGTADKYPHPLIGKRSLAQLARFIAKTMPEDDPGQCVGEDAEKVASYIYQEFYS